MLRLLVFILSIPTSFTTSEPACRPCNCYCNPTIVVKVKGDQCATHTSCPPDFALVDAYCFKIPNVTGDGVNQATAKDTCNRIGGQAQLAQFDTKEKLDSFEKWARNTLGLSKNKVGKCTGPIDLMFVLDESVSVKKKPFEEAKTFVIDVANQFDFGLGAHQARFGLITYSSPVDADVHLNHFDDIEQFKKKVESVKYWGGGTDTIEALKMAREMFLPRNGARVGVTKVLVLMTDGRATTSPIEEARKMKESGIKIFCIGVGHGISKAELQGVASSPTETYIMMVRQYNELARNILKLSDGLCKATSVDLWVSGKLTNSNEWIDGEGLPMPNHNTLVLTKNQTGRCVLVNVKTDGSSLLKSECDRKEGVVCEAPMTALN